MRHEGRGTSKQAAREYQHAKVKGSCLDHSPNKTEADTNQYWYTTPDFVRQQGNRRKPDDFPDEEDCIHESKLPAGRVVEIFFQVGMTC